MHATRQLPALVLVGLIAIPCGAAAQAALGVKGGVTFATADLAAFSSESQTGAVAGGFITLPAWGPSLVQVEAFYITRGFATLGFLAEGASARIGYLDIPVLMKLPLAASDARLRPSVMAGGYWGIELSCSTGGDIVELEGGDSCDGRFRRRGTADVGFIFGAGMDVDVSERWFVLLDGRFHLGMRNLHFDPEADSARSRAWSIIGGLGVRLGTGG